MSQTFIADSGAADRRLDLFLAGELGISRTQAQKLLKDDLVRVNERSEKSSYPVQPGDSISVEVPEPKVRDVVIPEFPIIYMDDDVVVIDKPAGVTVHPGNGRSLEATVADYARTVSTDPDPDRPGIVHRLDRETSGLMLIARSAEVKLQLQELWRSRKVKKRYVSLVIGRLSPAEAIIRLPLDRDPKHPTQRHVVSTGRPAVTKYHVMYDFLGYSFVEAFPETGRTHQLRVHFAALGHPIAGDIVYGAKQRPLGLTRQFLHASGLKLTLPSGKALDLEAPLPPDLETILEQLLSEL